MSTPILLVCGPAGSGKDTAAGIIARKYNGVCIAQADPMKRLAQKVFGFTDHQLWGPSEARNAPDERFVSADAWNFAAQRLAMLGHEWLADVLPDEKDPAAAFRELCAWFRAVAKAHGFVEEPLTMATDIGPWQPFAKFVGAATRILTARYALQTVGTEFGRTFSKNMWVDYAIRVAKKLLSGGFEYKRSYGLVEKKEERGPTYVIITDGRFRNEVFAVSEVGGIPLRVEPAFRTDDATKVEIAGVKGHVSEMELLSIPEEYYQFILENDKARGLAVLEASVDLLMLQLKYRTVRIRPVGLNCTTAVEVVS